ncbi:hypothetical protein FBR05_09860 [Deltaproteobacteria bacterium PRO3]|nr:hypothetical protein [Deltaproteobacteria bacterium PRO3]
MTASRLSQPLAVSTATAQPAPAPTSVARAALDDFARALPVLPGSAPKALLARLDELRRETDEGLLLTDLLALGIQLKSEHRAEAAYALLSRLSQEDIADPVRAKARAEADAIEGKGAAGPRAEFLLSRFCKDATDARVIAPMIAATLVGQVAGTAALGRLMGRPASWLTRGFGAELGAGAFGYGAEVVTFAGLNRALAPHPNGPFSHDLARSALTIGALKLSGFAVNSALAGPGTRFVARGRAPTLPFAAHQAGAFVGLTASHKLEEHWGLRPRVEGSTFLLDTFASLVSLGVGAHLGQRALGERFADFRSELGMAAKLQKYRPQEKARALLSPAVAGGDGRGLPPILMMSMGQPPGGPKGGRPSKGTSWQESQVPEPSDPLNGHISVTPADVMPRAPTEPPDPYIGTVFEGRYRINRKLGHGGMGVVYEAVHEIIGKKMALKLLRRDAMTKEMAERFLNEAKAASMIGNPHIIEITDFGRLAEGTPYFVMEYLEGTSLYGLIEGDRPVPIPRLVNIARQIAEGLADAHKAGIVHRDLKPENIFLINKGSKVDFVKILDFGIAKIANGGSKEKLTQAGVPFGTPQYMSPEQSAGQPTIDHRTDVYAFGMLLYEMATGRLPFNFENFQETLNAQMYVTPVPPSEMQPVKQPIPPGLEAIIMKAISKRPENRYQSMNEIIVELDKLQSGLVPVAVTELKNRSESADLPVDYFRTGLTPTNLRRSRRHWPIFAGIGIGGASALAAAFYALSRSNGVTAQPTAVPPPDDKPKPDAAPVDTAPTVTSLKRQVEVNVDPVDARVFRNGEDLGNNVVKVEMDPGQKVELEVKRDGYKSRKITLDGLEESVTVKLEKEKAVRPRPSGNPSGSGKPKTKPTNSGEVISPWK